MKPSQHPFIAGLIVLIAATAILIVFTTLGKRFVTPPHPLQLRGQITDVRGVPLALAPRQGPPWSTQYPEGETLAQVLGVTNKDGFGLEGLQLRHDATLSGKAGIPGNTLRLTLDLRNQRALESALKPYLTRYGKSVEALMLNRQGQIVAAATFPGFNPNQRQTYIAWQMKFRPVTDVFQPGPMLQPFFLAEGVEQHGPTFLSSQPTPENLATRLKMAWLQSALQRFALNQRTGIHFPGEAHTLIAKTSPQTDYTNTAGDQKIIPLQLAYAKGSGVAPTLMRYATSFASLLDGNLTTPTLESKPAHSTPPTPNLSPDTATYMRRYLANAAREAGHPDLAGTAAVWRSTSHEREHYAMAAVFEPTEQPDHLLLVKLVARDDVELPPDLGWQMGASLMRAQQNLPTR